MAELKKQAAQGRPAAAAASSSARGAASSSQKHDSRGKGDDDSPKSNMSSPWGTDVSLLTHACCEFTLAHPPQAQEASTRENLLACTSGAA